MGLGTKGTVTKAPYGYFRNYLLPMKLAMPLTDNYLAYGPCCSHRVPPAWQCMAGQSSMQIPYVALFSSLACETRQAGQAYRPPYGSLGARQNAPPWCWDMAPGVLRQ